MKPRSDATSWAVVLIAATSLALMITLYQIDWTIRGALNDYGLQFSYDWAASYWRFMQVGFALGWINIATAFAVQAYNIRMKRRAGQPADAIKNAWELARSPETEKDSQEEAEKKKEADPKKPADEKPINDREPEAQENQEEPQQPKETSEQEPQPPQNKSDETPILPGLFRALRASAKCMTTAPFLVHVTSPF